MYISLMTNAPNHIKQLSKYYTINYIVALCSLVVLFIAAFITSNQRMEQNTQIIALLYQESLQNARLQNLQYLSTRLVLENTPQKIDMLKDSIFNTLVSIKENHKILTQQFSDLLPDESKQQPDDIYANLNRNTQKTLNYAKTSNKNSFDYLDIYRHIQQQSFYSSYTKQIEKRIFEDATRLETLQSVGFILFLGILVAIVVFIFRPMLKRIIYEHEKQHTYQQFLSSVLETAGEGIIAVNQHQKIVLVNHAVQKLWDTTATMLHDIPWHHLLSPNAPEKDTSIEQLVNTYIETQGKKTDGTTFPLRLHITASPATADYSEPLYTIAATDITAEKNIQTQLRQYNETLEQKVNEKTKQLQYNNQILKLEIDERKEIEQKLAQKASELLRSNHDLEQFAYISAHDLKEPLRMITGFAQLLQHKQELQQNLDAKEYLSYIIEGALRANSQIDGLLQYTRLNDSDMPRAHTSTEQILETALQQLKSEIDSSQATIEYTQLPTLPVAPSQIQLLFVALLSNALKFKHPNTPPKINIHAVPQMNNYLFSIQDNGIGIKPEFAQKVFLIFKKLHNRSDYGGNGIGLALAKKIVEQHGGKIWFESSVDNGTTFFFTLPAA